jgi:hypothetical protein
MSSTVLFLLIFALGWYNVGTVWAHEVDIFRTWRLVPASAFHEVQSAHWHKLIYWVLLPVGLTLAGSLALIWYHPPFIPRWAVIGNAGCQLLSVILTTVLWAPWQVALSRDPAGPASRYLERILGTHWLRVLVITAGALCLLIGLGLGMQS